MPLPDKSGTLTLILKLPSTAPSATWPKAMPAVPILLLSLFLQAASPAAGQTIFEDFEKKTFGEWRETGNAFGKRPSSGKDRNQPGEVTGFAEECLASSLSIGVKGMGSLTSPAFTIQRPYLSFLVGGGSLRGLTSIQLIIGQKIVRESTGKDNSRMQSVTWDLSNLMGREARVRIVDASNQTNGYILVDHILFGDHPEPLFPHATRNGQPLIPGLTSSRTIPAIQIPPNSRLGIFANYEDHGLYSPLSVSIDMESNLLVTESHRSKHCVPDTRDHPYWLRDDIAATTLTDRRKLHRKWNQRYPIEKMRERSERIRLLRDTDHDGIADRSTIYAEGFDDLLDGAAGGIFPLDDRVYFACIPHIWSLRDTDSDGEADQRTKLVSGFGPRISLAGHDLDGFALGPDGRLYGSVGDRAMNIATQEGHQISYNDQGAVFRFDPDGSHFEVIHAGLRDPQGVVFDRWGNPVTVDSDSGQGDQARVVYIFDGADSGWRTGHQNLHTFHLEIGCSERPINQWMQEHQWDVLRKNQPAFLLPPVGVLPIQPAGFTYHPGTGFSNRCRDSFLICDNNGEPGSSGIWSFLLDRDGAGMKLASKQKFLWGSTATDLEFGNDGTLYVTDIFKKEKNQSPGRVFSLVSEPTPASPPGTEVSDLFQGRRIMNLPSVELFELMKHDDFRVRLRAQMTLASRPEAVPYFINATRQEESLDLALHGTWGLWIRARRLGSIASTNRLVELLSNPAEELRAQAARALGEAPLKDSGRLINSLKDSSPRVRAFAAISLARLRVTAAFNPTLLLLAENADRDVFLRHAGVMALAESGTEAQLTALSRHPSKAIRLASVLALRRLLSPGLIHFFFDHESEVADEAIRAVHDLPIENARPAVAALLDEYAPDEKGRVLSPMMMRRILHSSFRCGGEQNASRLLRFAANKRIPLGQRLEALRLLSQWSTPPTVDQSIGRYAPLPRREQGPVKALLAREIPSMGKLEPDISRAILDLTEQYGISPP